ncbi:MAG TPA: hypothetical protein PLJ60_09735 [Chryseolinea sp.]|nr:hypothetical protein [Chryseolinea sp.]
MKKIQTILIAGLLLMSACVFAQDYAFKVLANKGTNEVKSGDAWQPLKTGASLKSTDEVKLTDNAYLALVHSSGKPMELKEAKTYKVADLAASLKPGTSVLNKYADFILSSNSAEAKKNRLSATGAVHRGDDRYSIQVLLPENQHSGIYNSTAVINWDGSKVAGPYIVKLMNMYEEVLASVETPETTFQVDITDAKFANLTAVLVEVSSKADPKQMSTRHLIKKLPAAEIEKVKGSLDEIIGEVSEQTALNKYLLASFYENNNLFIDAIASYEDAIKLAPDVTFYREAYDEFLLRHGMMR